MSDSLSESMETLTESKFLKCSFMADQSCATFCTLTAVSSVSVDKEVAGWAICCFLSSLAALKSLILGEAKVNPAVPSEGPGVLQVR